MHELSRSTRVERPQLRPSVESTFSHRFRGSFDGFVSGDLGQEPVNYIGLAAVLRQKLASGRTKSPRRGGRSSPSFSPARDDNPRMA